jgi:hypothetical protein
VTVRLPEKLLKDIDAWAFVYRDEYLGMSRSTAIRCLLLLGLDRVSYRAIDPKDKTTYEGPTRPLLKFYTSGRVGKWLSGGTDKFAKRKPPIVHPKPNRFRYPTQAEIHAVCDRAIARSNRQAATRQSSTNDAPANAATEESQGFAAEAKKPESAKLQD